MREEKVVLLEVRSKLNGDVDDILGLHKEWDECQRDGPEFDGDSSWNAEDASIANAGERAHPVIRVVHTAVNGNQI